MVQLDNYNNSLKELLKCFDEPIPTGCFKIYDYRKMIWAKGPKIKQKIFFKLDREKYNQDFYVVNKKNKGAVKFKLSYTLLRRTHCENGEEINSYFILDNKNLVDEDKFNEITKRSE